MKIKKSCEESKPESKCVVSNLTPGTVFRFNSDPDSVFLMLAGGFLVNLTKNSLTVPTIHVSTLRGLRTYIESTTAYEVLKDACLVLE